MVAASRKEAGCLQYTLHVDKTDANAFWFYEEWESKEALAAHSKIARPKFSGLIEKGLITTPPVVRLLSKL